MRTFATPFKNGSLKKDVEVDFWDFHGRRKPEGKTQKETEKNNKFIEKTGNCTSKYREKIQFIEKR